jgi:hypothetical protein
MSVILAACVCSVVLGPVTGVAGVLRAGTGDLGGTPGTDTSRLTIIDDTLTPSVVQFVRARSGVRGQTDEVLIVDGRAAATSLPVRVGGGKGPAVLALVPDWWTIERSATVSSLATAAPARRAGPANPLEPPTPWVELVDGQRFVGRLAPPPADAAADEQIIRWSHPRLGTLAIELDALRRIVRPGLSTAADPSTLPDSVRADTVWLSNGDRFEGFIEGLSTADPASPQASTSLLITPAGAPRGTPPTSIGLDQLAAAVFANPAKPPEPGAARLWLGDGSVLSAQQVDIDATSGRVTIASTTLPGDPADQRSVGAAASGKGTSASLELNQLRAVSFDSSRLHPLSGQPIADFGPVDGRRIAPPVTISPVIDGGPAPLNAEDLILPGPMFVEWVLPAGATRLAGWATLDPAAAAWGDCDVRISVRGLESQSRELARGRINAESPALPINVALPSSAGVLRLEVLSGAAGPIQDRIILKRMLILTSGPGPR